MHVLKGGGIEIDTVYHVCLMPIFTAAVPFMFLIVKCKSSWGIEVACRLNCIYFKLPWTFLTTVKRYITYTYCKSKWAMDLPHKCFMFQTQLYMSIGNHSSFSQLVWCKVCLQQIMLSVLYIVYLINKYIFCIYYTFNVSLYSAK